MDVYFPPKDGGGRDGGGWKTADPQALGWNARALAFARARNTDQIVILEGGRLEMSALDMARLGLLVMADGRWDGETVLPDRDYRLAMLAPGSEAYPAWCYMWWRNDQTRFMLPFRDRVYDGVPIRGAPRDLIMAQGDSASRVIARRGRAGLEPGERGSFDRQFWDHLRKIWEVS